MDAEFDYIVVGAGAGGGVVASRLALAGHHVLVIDAGGPAAENRNSQVPLFHPYASEDPALSWRYFVRHYANNSPRDSKAECDGRILYPRGSAIGGSTAVNAMICIAPHHSDWDCLAAMTCDKSWKSEAMHKYFQRVERCQYVARPLVPDVQELNPGQHGFDGWLPLSRPDRGELFEKLDPALGHLIAAALFANDPELAKAFDNVRDKYEAARPILLEHVKRSIGNVLDEHKLLQDIGRSALRDLSDPGMPGTDDLQTIPKLTEALEHLAVTLQQIREHPQELPLQKLYLFEAFGRLKRIIASLDSVLDPNDIRVLNDRRQGVFFGPQSIDARTGRRTAVADFLNQVREQKPGNLTIKCGVYVSRLLLIEHQGGYRAAGVECIPGEQIFEGAHQGYRKQPTGPPFEILARHEVILCAGALNTPQLLLLSGIGSKAEIEQANSRPHDAREIRPLVNLPGVGRNLHDRYEITVLYNLEECLTLLKECVCEPDCQLETDPDWQRWERGNGGLYATNGAVIAFSLRSRKDSLNPDLFVFGLPGRFVGYKIGYSRALLADGGRHRWSWVILKAHSRNRKGTVQLASRDPLAMPDVCFNYFDPGNADDRADLEDLQTGVRFVRDMMNRFGPDGAVEEGKLAGKEGADLSEVLRSEAWGHHACGTCKIGADDDPHAVLSSDFRVRGTWNVRVVDASVFPNIPGFFLAMPIYMVAEKASDVIHAASAAPPAASAALPRSKT
jgi:choline dehydrogenase